MSRSVRGPTDPNRGARYVWVALLVKSDPRAKAHAGAAVPKQAAPAIWSSVGNLSVGVWTDAEARLSYSVLMISQSNLDWVWSQLDAGLAAPGWRAKAHGEEQLIQRLSDGATFSRRAGGAWEEIPPVLFPD